MLQPQFKPHSIQQVLLKLFQVGYIIYSSFHYCATFKSTKSFTWHSWAKAEGNRLSLSDISFNSDPFALRCFLMYLYILFSIQILRAVLSHKAICLNISFWLPEGRRVMYFSLRVSWRIHPSIESRMYFYNQVWALGYFVFLAVPVQLSHLIFCAAWIQHALFDHGCLSQVIPGRSPYGSWDPGRCLRCAVVGNSGNLRGAGYGATIDGHNYIMRWGCECVKYTKEWMHGCITQIKSERNKIDTKMKTGKPQREAGGRKQLERKRKESLCEESTIPSNCTVMCH